MDREAPAQLGREAPVEIIPRQQALIEQLAARVAELEATVARLGEPPKASGNSSVPSSAGFKANRAERRARRRRCRPARRSTRSSSPGGSADAAYRIARYLKRSGR